MVTTLTTNRKQRLRTLENRIRKNAESIGKTGLEIGMDLIEIREEELWTDEYESWSAYLKKMTHELVGKSFSQAATLIRAAEVCRRLPEGCTLERTTSHMKEIARLAPDIGKKNSRTGGTVKDFSRLKERDVARVEKVAIEIAGGKSPSVRDVQKAVDNELGIDRAAKARQTKEKNENQGIELADYMRSKIGQIEAIADHLAEVPADGWTLLEDCDPGLAKRLATVCDELAELLRS